MVRHKVILRARKPFSLMDFITLSLDGTNTYNIKFCPRAIWLNVWMPRAKNTFIDLGIKIYLYAFQTDISVHLEALVLVLGWVTGGTGLATHKNRLPGIIRAASRIAGRAQPVPGELTCSRMRNVGFLEQTAGSTGSLKASLAEQGTSPQQKRFLQRNEGNKSWQENS